MIRTKAQKAELVTTLAERLRGSPTIYVTDFTGLDVAMITQLRRRLRQAGAEYAVVKNTLARRAFDAAQVAGIEGHLDGPTALVLGGADPVAPAKIFPTFLLDFSVFPGNSGGPVFMTSQDSRRAGTTDAPPAEFIAGLLTQQVELNSERLEIGIVTHAQYIRETIARVSDSAAPVTIAESQSGTSGGTAASAEQAAAE